MIDGAFPARRPRRLLAATATSSPGSISPASPRRRPPGSIGPLARALGGASLPLFDRYLVDQHDRVEGAPRMPPPRPA